MYVNALGNLQVTIDRIEFDLTEQTRHIISGSVELEHVEAAWRDGTLPYPTYGDVNSGSGPFRVCV